MRIASLPRSLRAILAHDKRMSGDPTFSEQGHPSRQMMVQGTRAGAWQGTSSAGNTPDPLQPGRSVTPGMPPGWDDETEMPSQANFSFDKTEVPNTEHTNVQNYPWPANPSKTIMGARADGNENLRSDYALQVGPPPGRIIRHMPYRVFGFANGMNTGHPGSEGFPWNADKDFLPHTPIARQALGTKGPQKLSDDNVNVPAVFAGNPRQ